MAMTVLYVPHMAVTVLCVPQMTVTVLYVLQMSHLLVQVVVVYVIAIPASHVAVGARMEQVTTF